MSQLPLIERSHRLLLSLIALVLATLGAAMTVAVTPASAEVFANATPITIPDHGPASPQPSFIQVSGLRGPAGNLVVTLHGVTHTNPDDLDVLLLSPDGRRSVLMSDACGAGDVTNYTWSFPLDVQRPMGNACPEITYRQTDREPGVPDVWPFAPPGANESLRALTGSDPNGSWGLHVVDDSPGSQGQIKFGWSLRIDAAPPDILVPGTGTSGPADLYPVSRTVSGLNGVISDVNVDLLGAFHDRPDDLDVLLVGPRGQKVALMSDACGVADGGARTNFAFNDAVRKSLPDVGPCPSASYRPADHEPGESLPSPAPVGPYETALSAFNFTDPNGEWRLYVSDDSFGADGWIEDGKPFSRVPFTLDITTRPRARVAFSQGAVTLTEGETAELTLARTGAAELGAGRVTVTSAPASATSGEDFTPVARTVEFAAGETQKTVSVEALADSLPEGTETFTLAIAGATGDAEAASPPTAVVTIRDATPATAEAPGLGEVSGSSEASGSGGAGGGAAADRDAPVIGPVTLAPAAFAVARGTTARAAAQGTTISYSVSETAAVTLRFQRAVAGRRVGRSCRPLSAGNRRQRPCRRYVAAGTLRRAGRPGANRVAFSGRIGRRALRPGVYRLLVTAVDPAGNRSVSGPRAFRVVR